MLNMYKGIPNSPITTITNFINNADTEIVVANATAIPETPNLLVLGGDTDSPETVKLISKDGVNLTVERGFQGTAKNWDIGTKISRNFTEYDYNALVENVGELSTSKVDNSKVLTDVPANAKFTDTVTDVLDSLTSTSATKALSANKGKYLNDTHDNHAKDYVLHSGYGLASGTNTKTITLDPAPTAYVNGMTIVFRNLVENTGLVTINVNGLGSKYIRTHDGNNLVSGDLKANVVYTIIYNGSSFTLQTGIVKKTDVVDNLSSTATDKALSANQGKVLDDKIDNLTIDLDAHKADYVSHAGYGTASGTNAKTITLNPAPSGYKEGMTVAFKNVTQNTGAVTLNVNGKGAKPVLKSNGSALSSGNLKAGSIYTVRYNGSNFILQGEGGEYGTAQASDVLSGKTIGTEEGIKTGTMPNNGSISKTITTQGGQIIIPKGYHSGSGIVKALFANLVAGNIKKGVSIGGIEGSYDGPPIVFDMISRVSEATIELGVRPKALMLASAKENPSGYIYSDGTYSSGTTYNRTLSGYDSPRVTILSNGFYFEGSTANWHYLVIG